MADAESKAAVQAWAARWKLVNDAEAAELRSASPELKLAQLASLMASVDEMGWRAALEDPAEAAFVRARWKELRAAYGV